MKKIRRILFLGCILLNISTSILNALEYNQSINIVLNILKAENNPTKIYEAIADSLLKCEIYNRNVPKITGFKAGSLLYKEYINVGTTTFKRAPVEVRKIFYKAACGLQSAVKKIKQEYLNTIKAHEAIIADYNKKNTILVTLNKKIKLSEKEAKTQLDLQKELGRLKNAYDHSNQELKDVVNEYEGIDFNAIEQWINEIKSIAYWNSGSGFFEQFWNLNWSGKVLTFVGTPLACYGAYKLYNDYQSAEDEDVIEEGKTAV